jgi:hypothetical protein
MQSIIDKMTVAKAAAAIKFVAKCTEILAFLKEKLDIMFIDNYTQYLALTFAIRVRELDGNVDKAAKEAGMILHRGRYLFITAEEFEKLPAGSPYFSVCPKNDGIFDVGISIKS